MININTKYLASSSLKDTKEHKQSKKMLESRKIEVTTLDKILELHPDIELPIFLKIDTEGYDLEVIKGATELLKVTDTVISEVSGENLFLNSYSFEEFIVEMHKNGFTIFDFLCVIRNKNQIGIHHMDIVFKKIYQS